MESDGFLCDLCSEIYEVESELIEHMFDDHEITNYVPTDYLMDNESPESFIEIDEDSEDGEVETKDLDIKDADDIVIDLTTNNNHDDNNAADIQVIGDGDEAVSSNLKNSNANDPGEDVFVAPVKRKRGRPPLPKQTYFCEHCDYKTMIKSVMKTHKLIHTMDCPYCPFKTVRENCLTEHIRMEHLDENGAEKSLWMQGSGGSSWMVKDFLFADLANRNATVGFPVSPHSFSYLSQCLRPTIIRNTKNVEIAQSAFDFLKKMGLVNIKSDDVKCN